MIPMYEDVDEPLEVLSRAMLAASAAVAATPKLPAGRVSLGNPFIANRGPQRPATATPRPAGPSSNRRGSTLP